MSDFEGPRLRGAALVRPLSFSLCITAAPPEDSSSSSSPPFLSHSECYTEHGCVCVCVCVFGTHTQTARYTDRRRRTKEQEGPHLCAAASALMDPWMTGPDPPASPQ